jgi:hypothetical protein
MPTALGIGVLGAWTSEASERVLSLAKELNAQFTQLGSSLQSQASAIAADVEGIEATRGGLLMPRADDKLRNSRRIEFDEVTRLNEKARQLQVKTQRVLQSLRFVEEGTKLLEDLDAILDFLLALYPKPEKPLDLEAASAGYTMQAQHAVHATVFGGEETKVLGRVTEPAEGQDYGANVELF